ncbi:MAG: cysteine--tRNA ligase [Deltaproteobacteria bacterium]|nr:cysteine--tRNA ligase [Deltaproteobacteria bacterium]
MLKIFNTKTGAKEEFKVSGNRVLMYVCGPTVYDLSHIGHARSAVSFDAVYRYLKYAGYEVKFAKNYTDIDDKIINRANKEGRTSEDVAAEFIKAYDEDMASLGVELPSIRPKATETIEKIIEVIERLVEKGFAYVMDGDVYYSVRKFKEYGKLSGKNIEDLEAGARVDVNERKNDPLDFALWKASKPNEPKWKSPWGEGRPGWHIECSAMCLEHLGETIDIHGGGKDLVFPHHENEVAQSEAAIGKTFARYWMHNGFVNIESEKMSKSLGNILTIKEVLKRNTAESVRLFLLSSHYRSPIEYSADSLVEAEAKASRFYKTLERVETECPEAVKNIPDKKNISAITGAMDDDFNTAAVVGEVFKEIADINRALDSGKKDVMAIAASLGIIKEAGKILGTFDKTPAAYFGELKAMAALPKEEIERLINERLEAKKNKDFKRADAIRAELKEKGIMLEDTASGTVWTVKN